MPVYMLESVLELVKSRFVCCTTVYSTTTPRVVPAAASDPASTRPGRLLGSLTRREGLLFGDCTPPATTLAPACSPSSPAPIPVITRSREPSDRRAFHVALPEKPPQLPPMNVRAEPNPVGETKTFPLSRRCRLEPRIGRARCGFRVVALTTDSTSEGTCPSPCSCSRRGAECWSSSLLRYSSRWSTS